jgi:hypothetical protein
LTFVGGSAVGRSWKDSTPDGDTSVFPCFDRLLELALLAAMTTTPIRSSTSSGAAQPARLPASRRRHGGRSRSEDCALLAGIN